MTRLDLNFFKRGFLFIILIVSTVIVFVPENLSTNIWKAAQINFYKNIKDNITNIDQVEYAFQIDYEYLNENTTIEKNTSTLFNQSKIALTELSFVK